jgi:hypothetical protein
LIRLQLGVKKGDEAQETFAVSKGHGPRFKAAPRGSLCDCFHAQLRHGCSGAELHEDLTLDRYGCMAISNIFVTGSNGNVQIPWVPGHTDHLQISKSPTPTNWAASGATPTQSSNPLTFVDSGGATNVPTRFYRVLVTPP